MGFSNGEFPEADRAAKRSEKAACIVFQVFMLAKAQHNEKKYNGHGVLALTNKACFQCLHSLVKTEANVWENSRADQ